MQRIHGRRAAARRTRRRFFAELPFLLVAALILTVLVKGFLIQAFFIPSRSMEPTLDVGDRVVVNRLAYRLGDPAHGQVVVFLRPTTADQAPAPVSDMVRGFAGLEVHRFDGTDYWKVRKRGAKAIAHVRAGVGPALLHVDVTRPYSHSSAMLS